MFQVASLACQHSSHCHSILGVAAGTPLKELLLFHFTRMEWGRWGPYWVLRRSLGLADPGDLEDSPSSALHPVTLEKHYPSFLPHTLFLVWLAMSIPISQNTEDGCISRISSLLHAKLWKGRAGGDTVKSYAPVDGSLVNHGTFLQSGKAWACL